MPTGDVSCSEGDVVEAAATQGIDFGGVTSAWTPDFENQGTMIARYKAKNNIPESAELMEHMGWSGAEGYEMLSQALVPFSAAADTSRLASTVSGALGGPVSFTDSSAGTIKVSADGTLR